MESLIDSLTDIVAMYPYGSRVYGTNTKDSDYDYITVIKGSDGFKTEQSINSCGTVINNNIYDEKAFLNAICEHEISVLECLCLPKNKVVISNRNFNYTLDLFKLRESISRIASNSFVKAKKKLIIEEDFNPYIARKSLFHSLRILNFGIQLAKHGKIIDFSQANHYWNEIQLIETNDWEVFKEIYKPVYNELASQFRLLAPKK